MLRRKKSQQSERKNLCVTKNYEGKVAPKQFPSLPITSATAVGLGKAAVQGNRIKGIKKSKI